jgi:hypothetical protein
MRLAFKWLACGYVGGEFRYEAANVGKISDKMDAYTREALDMLKSADFDGDSRFFRSKYVVTDLLRIKQYINDWGVKITDAKRVVYNNIYCADAMRAPLPHYFASRRSTLEIKDMALMITFYMRLTKGFVQGMLPAVKFAGEDDRAIVAGHAVAYFGGDNTFFDPNCGVFRLKAETHAEIAEEIEAFISETYPVTGDALDWTVLRIARRL